MQLSVVPDWVTNKAESDLKRLSGNRKDPAAERQRLRHAVQEFEGLMVEMMVKEMRKAVPKSGLFGKNAGRDIFNEMLDSKYSRLIVDRGGFGLTALMMRQLAGPAQSGPAPQHPHHTPLGHGPPSHARPAGLRVTDGHLPDRGGAAVPGKLAPRAEP